MDAGCLKVSLYYIKERYHKDIIKIQRQHCSSDNIENYLFINKGVVKWITWLQLNKSNCMDLEIALRHIIKRAYYKTTKTVWPVYVKINYNLLS